MTESLERFIQAQASTYDHALLELQRGRKEGHWMWFIFPQLRGLGVSENATYYGLRGIDEARDYLQHPLLGPRLERATRAVLDSGAALEKLLGPIDAMKFASCMTLFAAAAGGQSVYAQALEGGLEVDSRTLELLKEQESRNV
ncbi:Uncharacterized protein, DUF1810 family [Pseudomonas sp. NFACC23-1]|uniref:DUF1810 domain-containing protein n=1 Tax=unclassified Pseudomonas TaxID=196821 RepID=UPI00087F4B50|nr:MULTISPECIES: DUF1810 domain-containing protein [unclassified Pseudomonas]SDB57877.1 Uncharacterized protein, DUF1810 family [Pseudomonas sp. NFACC17-2]SEJ80661.1 Uncharacterized protein, DUF1810 family [Pseudomonas sp. NFACC23-1]SFW89815.1 Uncharacterized protein, DUF1810 family [Pseudomonas sp. NFACC16-2]